MGRKQTEKSLRDAAILLVGIVIYERFVYVCYKKVGDHIKKEVIEEALSAINHFIIFHHGLL
jgi:hypothetical protein